MTTTEMKKTIAKTLKTQIFASGRFCSPGKVCFSLGSICGTVRHLDSDVMPLSTFDSKKVFSGRHVIQHSGERMGLAKLSPWKGRLIVSVSTLSCRKRTAPGEAAVSSAVKRKTTPALFHTKETSVLPGLCPCGPVQTLIPSHLKTGRFPN